MGNYYQPEIETMPLEQLQLLQSERLVEQVKHVYKNVEFYRLKSLHFRYISKISKFRTKISDLGNFLYGICRFYAIYTKTTLTLQVQTKLSRKRELLGPK